MTEELETGLMQAQRAVFSSSLGSAEKLVMLALLDHWSRAEPYPYPGIDRLAQWTGLGARTVRRTIGVLEQSGALCVRREVGRGNRYDLGAAFSCSLPGVCAGNPGHGGLGARIKGEKISARAAPDPGHGGRGTQATVTPVSADTRVRVAGDPGQGGRGTQVTVASEGIHLKGSKEGAQRARARPASPSMRAPVSLSALLPSQLLEQPGPPPPEVAAQIEQFVNRRRRPTATGAA